MTNSTFVLIIFVFLCINLLTLLRFELRLTMSEQIPMDWLTDWRAVLPDWVTSNWQLRRGQLAVGKLWANRYEAQQKMPMAVERVPQGWEAAKKSAKNYLETV